jgi:Ser/Thr protein kinase RdoA (MazF antagonist)
MSDATLGLPRQLTKIYGLHDVGFRRLNTPVNDVFRVTSSTGEFALKLYHRNRTAEAVEWEADLVAYLHARGAPVVRPIRGRDGYLEHLVVEGRERLTVLFTWAPGAKPTPGLQTYRLLGEAAARIHHVADGLPPRHRGRSTTRLS